MEKGFLLDRAHNNRPRVSTWVEGEPESSFWTGLKLKGRAQRPCVALRCTRCGYLEFYAGEQID
jgi:hypothetical protein